jgi:hypothetical protein
MAGGRAQVDQDKTRRIGDFTGNDKRATIDGIQADLMQRHPGNVQPPQAQKNKGRLATSLSAQDQHHQAAGITLPV